MPSGQMMSSVGQGDVTYKPPPNEAGGTKGFGKGGCEGLGCPGMGESSLPAGGRAIKEDCLREVVTGITKGWAGFRYPA